MPMGIYLFSVKIASLYGVSTDSRDIADDMLKSIESRECCNRGLADKTANANYSARRDHFHQ